MFLYFIYGSGSAATTIESYCQSVRFLRVKRAGCARVRTAVAWRPHVVGFGDLRMIYVYACVKSTIVVLVNGCVRFIAYYLTLLHPQTLIFLFKSFVQKTNSTGLKGALRRMHALFFR